MGESTNEVKNSLEILNDLHMNDSLVQAAA
jgi:hypothetical protein